ncbi:MAG: hypothetical protein AMS25_12695 [Gemmatimonas sp. SM23_52]|nr:MAG: hypothetical protein AMS25_12695 [Gemmatimonas sp. SM23_52]
MNVSITSLLAAGVPLARRCRVLLSLLTLLVFPLLGGCESDITPPEVDRDTTAPIQTDRPFYWLRTDWVGFTTEIALSYENQAADTLYIVNCLRTLPAVLEKEVDGVWERFWAPILPRCLSPPIVMEPGGVLVDTLHVWGALPGHNVGPAFKSEDVKGVYRIVMHQVVFHYDENSAGFGDPVPLEYRVSNAFALWRIGSRSP